MPSADALLPQAMLGPELVLSRSCAADAAAVPLLVREAWAAVAPHLPPAWAPALGLTAEPDSGDALRFDPCSLPRDTAAGVATDRLRAARQALVGSGALATALRPDGGDGGAGGEEAALVRRVWLLSVLAVAATGNIDELRSALATAAALHRGTSPAAAWLSSVLLLYHAASGDGLAAAAALRRATAAVGDTDAGRCSSAAVALAGAVAGSCPEHWWAGGGEAVGQPTLGPTDLALGPLEAALLAVWAVVRRASLHVPWGPPVSAAFRPKGSHPEVFTVVL